MQRGSVGSWHSIAGTDKDKGGCVVREGIKRAYLMI